MSAVIDPSQESLAMETLSARGMKPWVTGVVEKRRDNTGALMLNKYRK